MSHLRGTKCWLAMSHHNNAFAIAAQLWGEALLHPSLPRSGVATLHLSEAKAMSNAIDNFRQEIVTKRSGSSVTRKGGMNQKNSGPNGPEFLRKGSSGYFFFVLFLSVAVGLQHCLQPL